MFTIDRNRRSPSTGTSVHDRLELVFTIRRNAQLREAGFVDVAIAVNPKSRDTIASWAPGRGIETCVASAMVEAHKPLRA